MTGAARTDVRIPRETVNDDVVRIVSWAVADGARVTRGMPLAEIDTSKAAIEVVAEADGLLRILKPAQTDVPIGEAIGTIEAEGAAAGRSGTLTPTPLPKGEGAQAASTLDAGQGAQAASTLGAEEAAHMSSPLPLGEAGRRPGEGAREAASIPSPLTPTPLPSGQGLPAVTVHDDGTAFATEPLVSQEAAALLAAHGLTAADFAGSGMITADLVRHRVDPHAARATAATTAAPSRPVAPPATGNTEDPAAAFAGARARWAARGRRGLAGDAAASAGHRGTSVVWLAANYAWRNWFLGLVVRVAPRGIDLMVHRLRGVKIGRDCFVDPTAILETAYPERIRLGDDVRIAAKAVLMTHIKAPDLLRESGAVPPVDAGITLESHSFVGVNACIMPGVTVGEGAVVASGAVVLKDVPPYTMVAGNPAQVVKTLRPRG
jgi:acetyltransferase-like isoleucine patch superfamily enzyme